MDLAIERPRARCATRARGALRVPSALLGPALVAPSLALLALFTYGPVLGVLWQSARVERRGVSRFVGLDNYVALAADPAFRRALANNLAYALATVVPSLVLALGFALVLERSTRVNAALRGLLFLPTLIPLVAAASIFLFLFLPGVGLIDHHLAKLGLAGANWLGDPDVALGSLAVLTVWKNAGYYALFVLAGLQAIPRDLHEAAALDGASAWQRLRFVTLPGLRGTLAFVATIAGLNAVTGVDHVFVLTKGGPSDATNLLLFYVYQQAVERYDVGRAAAATVVTLALLLGLTYASLRRAERGEAGAAP